MALTRKERERQAREELILSEAHRMILNAGYLGLNMDRLAEAVEYSKATLYNHFKTKEDLICAVAVRSMKVREELFTRAFRFTGNTRERCLAFGVADELFVRAHREHFEIEMLLHMTSLKEKTEETRLAELHRLEGSCMNMFIRTVHEAIGAGDLPQTPFPPEKIAHILRCMALGFHLLLSREELESPQELKRQYQLKHYNSGLYLDGLGWKPLSSEWDYAESYARVVQELFVSEFESAYSG